VVVLLVPKLIVFAALLLGPSADSATFSQYMAHVLYNSSASNYKTLKLFFEWKRSTDFINVQYTVINQPQAFSRQVFSDKY
jgi:hypothetical protein